MPGNVSYEPTVATFGALCRRGVTADRIAAQLAARRWRRWGYAIVLHNGPLSRREQWFVARVHGGTNAVLTAFTAAEARGLTGWERDTAHVLVALGSSGSARCPVPLRLHHTRNWARVLSYGRGPVQIAAQALVVAAGTFSDARPACGILAAGVQQRLVGADDLGAVLDDEVRVRHRRLLRLAVADIGQGSEALSEIDFVRLCRRAGLPEPERQAVRQEPGGRRRYLDAAWRRADGRLVVVEIDGALHLSQRRWWDDQARQNELALADALVLRYPSAVVRTQPQVVLAQLRRALHL
jgi:hypothetical protein